MSEIIGVVDGARLIGDKGRYVAVELTLYDTTARKTALFLRVPIDPDASDYKRTVAYWAGMWHKRLGVTITEG